MPDFERVSAAFNIPFVKIHNHKDLNQKLEEIYRTDDLMLIEWPQDPAQLIEPKTMTRKDENGNVVSTPIDDLYPFLSRAEYEAMQFSNWKNN